MIVYLQCSDTEASLNIVESIHNKIGSYINRHASNSETLLTYDSFIFR